MPLDHYVSQVHLKNFYAPSLGNRLLYARRKSDLREFTPDAYSVCRIESGSTNLYLNEPRAIEDFLKTIEPNYNAALAGLATGAIDARCIRTISGFVAYVVCCSPAGMRVLSAPLKSIVSSTTAIVEAQGLLPPPPPSLGAASPTDLIQTGKIAVKVDPKFPQALGIDSIMRTTATFGNSKWEILHNTWSAAAFCTSDFPVGVEETGNVQIINRIVPLSPTLAIRIHPDLTKDPAKSDLSFANFGYRSRSITREEALELNRLIVRCAEDTVFYRDALPWMRTLVEENRRYRVEIDVHRLGPIQFFRQRVIAAR